MTKRPIDASQEVRLAIDDLRRGQRDFPKSNVRMKQFRITGLGDGRNERDAVNLGQLNEAVRGIAGGSSSSPPVEILNSDTNPTLNEDGRLVFNRNTEEVAFSTGVKLVFIPTTTSQSNISGQWTFRVIDDSDWYRMILERANEDGATGNPDNLGSGDNLGEYSFGGYIDDAWRPRTNLPVRMIAEADVVSGTKIGGKWTLRLEDSVSGGQGDKIAATSTLIEMFPDLRAYSDLTVDGDGVVKDTLRVGDEVLVGLQVTEIRTKPTTAGTAGIVVEGHSSQTADLLDIGPNAFSGGAYLYVAAGGKVGIRNEVEMDGDLNHDGSNVGFFGTFPTTAAAALAALTDSSGGSANDTVAAVSGSGDDATINDNFADLTAKINALITAAKRHGLMAT